MSRAARVEICQEALEVYAQKMAESWNEQVKGKTLPPGQRVTIDITGPLQTAMDIQFDKHAQERKERNRLYVRIGNLLNYLLKNGRVPLDLKKEANDLVDRIRAEWSENGGPEQMTAGE